MERVFFCGCAEERGRWLCGGALRGDFLGAGALECCVLGVRASGDCLARIDVGTFFVVCGGRFCALMSRRGGMFCAGQKC